MTDASLCVFSWGGGDLARGWRGRSGGSGPAQLIPGTHARRIAASRNSLALAGDGQVLTWGFNDSRGGGDSWYVRGGHSISIPDSGQLGRSSDGSGRRRRDASTPGPVAGALAAEGALSIASGRYHALAIGARSRAVYSWGLNDMGQLGRTAWAGRAADRVCSSGSHCRDGMPRLVSLTPRTMPAPAAVAVASGRYFSLAVTSDGRAWAWGRCRCGRARTVEAVATDDAAHNAATAGAAAGLSVDEIATSVPYVIQGGGLDGEKVVQVAAGYAHMLLLTTSGTLYACESGDDGYGGRLSIAPPPGSFGQLGPGVGSAYVPRRVPAADLGAAPPLLIAAGRCASFVVDALGAVYAWGCSQGTGHPPPDRHHPTRFEPLGRRTVSAIAAGEYHALAVADGEVLVWGAGASSATPTTVRGVPRGATDVAAGYQHSLALAPCDGGGGPADAARAAHIGL